MKLSKIFHFLYFSVLAIPLVSIPIFAIYSQNHEINDNTLQVQENKAVDFNQRFEANRTNNISQEGNIFSTKFFEFETTHKYMLQFTYVNILSNTNHCLFGVWNNSNTTYIRYDTGYLTSSNGIYQNIVTYSMLSGNLTDLTSVKCCLQCFGTYQGINPSQFNQIEFVDLTQMFGEGNEPTLQEYNSYIDIDTYFPYTESEEVVIENYETITYNDTDIMSQFMYQEYNFMDKYLGMYKYQPFNGIYSWLSNTFFGGSAPLVFTIFYQWFSYWLFVSLCWMVFDVLIYIPMVAHRWLDKGALE